MATDPEIATPSEESERAPLVKPGGDVVGSPGTCPICKAPLQGRQKSACSPRCRAAKSRRRRAPMKREELQAIRAALRRTIEEAWQAQQLVEAALRER